MSDNKLKLLRVIDALEKSYSFRKNIVKNTLEYSPKSQSKFQEVNEHDLVIGLHHKGISASTNDVITFLLSSRIESYNPLLAYFLKCHEKYKQQRNDVNYIQDFLDHIITEDRYRFIVQTTKWFVRTVKCVIDDRYFNKQAIVLVSSGVQNLGKSTLTRFLLPDELTSYYVENPKLTKDGEIAMSSNFLCLLDDLGNMQKSDLEDYKSYMSRLHVNLRHPFEKKAKMTPRRVSFIGTTDTYEFLTGDANVRWICFDVMDIDWKYSSQVDIDLVWGQAYDLYLNNFSCEISKDEMASNEKSNNKYKVHTIEYEMIQKYYAIGTEVNHDVAMMSSEILNDLQIKTYLKFNDKKIGQALRSLGYQQVSRRNHVNTDGEVIADSRRVYFLKNLLTT